VLLLVAAGRRTDARALAGFVPDCAVLIKRLAAAPVTTRSQRLVLVLLAAYLLVPIDIVPDFIPIAGQLDDAVLMTIALGWLLRTHGERAIREAWPGPDSSLRVVLHAAGASRATREA
jgi:uncharacterized membrane protein YkvA (DUF1232 family)